MSKLISELSIEELEQELKARKELAKQEPKLRRHRESLLRELEKVEQQLALIAPGLVEESSAVSLAAPSGRPAGKRGRPRKNADGPKKRGRGPKRTPTGRLPKGVLPNAILDALADRELKVSEIVAYIQENVIPTIERKNVSVALNKLKATGKIENPSRGVYKAV